MHNLRRKWTNLCQSGGRVNIIPSKQLFVSRPSSVHYSISERQRESAPGQPISSRINVLRAMVKSITKRIHRSKPFYVPTPCIHTRTNVSMSGNGGLSQWTSWQCLPWSDYTNYSQPNGLPFYLYADSTESFKWYTDSFKSINSDDKRPGSDSA